MAQQFNLYTSKNVLFGDSWANDPTIKPKTVAKGLSQLDISQSHFFTIELSGMVHPLMQHNSIRTEYSMSPLTTDVTANTVYRKDENGNNIVNYRERGLLDSPSYKVSSGYGRFLPIKSVSVTESGISTLTLPLGIFADFPIAHRKKISRINITIVDTDDDWYEQQLRKWYQQTIPDEGGYVGYMSDIIRGLTFTSYNTKGNKNFDRKLWVMLVDDMQYNRDYETNGFKEISFSVAVVGTGN